MEIKEPNAIHFASRSHWREWLSGHHDTETSVWILFYKKHTSVATLCYPDAVDEALCFGWIDSKALPVDKDRYIQFFCRRKSKGTWSKVNKEKIKRLIEAGCMTKVGLDTIEAAMQNGSWTTLDDVEEGIVPPYLQRAFRGKTKALRFFDSLSRSDKRNLLQWLVLAKRPDTRQKRIDEIVSAAKQNVKPGILNWTKKEIV